MKKWLTIGGVLMLAVWSPFLWKELTSSPVAKKGRELPSDEPAPDPAAAAGAPAPAQPEPTEPEPAAQKPAADPGAKPVEPARAKSDPAQPGDPNEADNPDDTEDDEPAPPPRATGPTEVLKAAYDNQTRDALWAKDTETRIGTLFTGDVPAEMLQNANCRKAVCRLQLRWTRERATAYVAVYQSLHQEFGPEVGVEPIGALDADGRQQVDIYVTRKGYTIADLAK
jgi:hypothetical protein